MVKKKIKKTKIKIEKKKRKTKLDNAYKKRQIASILVWIAIVFLLFNGIYAIVVRESLVSELDAQSVQELESMGITAEMMQTTIIYIAVIWIVFAALFFLTKIGIEKKKIGWGWLLALSIITLLTGRFESALLGIIASILYAKSK